MPSEGGIVLLAGPGEATHIVFHALAASLPISSVILEQAVPRKQLLRNRVKRLGLPVVTGQVVFQGLLVPALRRVSEARIREIHELYGMDASPIAHPSLTRVRSVNDDATIELLRRLRPAAVAVQGTRILSPKLLQAVPCPFINMHAGLTPLFRGVHGGYWAAASGQPALCGVTVHLVDAGVDTGGILDWARVDVGPQDSFVTYPLLQLARGLPLMIRALQAAMDGTLEVKPGIAGESRIWSHPTAWGYLWRRITRGVR